MITTKVLNNVSFILAYCFVFNITVQYIFIVNLLLKMTTKHLPYKKPYKNQGENYVLREQPNRLTEKSRMGKSRLATAYTPERKTYDPSPIYKPTERKQKLDYSMKSDALLQQNKFLLVENSQLSALVAERGQIILTLEEKLEQQMNQEVRTLEEIQFEKNRFIQQFHLKSRQYDKRIQSLLTQIQMLNDDLYQMQKVKNQEIDNLKLYYQAESKRQMEAMLDSHMKTVSQLQSQIRKLKQGNEKLNNELAQRDQQTKAALQKCKHQIAQLNNQIDHINHIKNLEHSEQKVYYQNLLHTQNREAKKENQVAALNYEIQLKKVGHQLKNKNLELQQTISALQSGKKQTETKNLEIEEKRQSLLTQLRQLQQYYKMLLFREKQNLKQMNKTELEATQATYISEIDSLKLQISKLLQINQTKNQQISKLYDNLNNLRISKNQEIEQRQKLIGELKDKLKENKEQFLEQDQAFKTKMAQLHQSDIKSLRNYYENQLAIQLQDLQNREAVIKENREKVHKQIQQKTQLRKQFQLQLNKLKIKIGQLQVKLAAQQVDKRQQQGLLTSKIQLTSMNLIREANQKQKINKNYDQERKKIHTIIESKDKQIETLNDKIKQLQDLHKKQIYEKDQLIDTMQKQIAELSDELKREKNFYENEIKKKDNFIASDKEFYENQINKMKAEHSQEYSDTVNSFTKDKNQLESQKNQFKIKIKALQAQLALTKQHKQQQGIDRDVTLNQQKQRLKNEKDKLEVKLKNYFQAQIQSKNKQISDLQLQLHEKQQDIRDGAIKYNKLEVKLNKLLESQQKLRQIQNKVMAMGEDNNSIKNLAQFLKHKRRV